VQQVVHSVFFTVVSVVATLLTVGLTGGTIAVIQATSTEKSVSDCYSAADLSSRHTGVAWVPPPTRRPMALWPGQK